MRTLRIRRIARAEILEAFTWYLARSSQAATRFVDAVDVAICGIEEDPERYRPVHGMLRRWLLVGFPYAVYYKVFPTITTVVGVIHGSRHPDTWQRRAEP